MVQLHVDHCVLHYHLVLLVLDNFLRTMGTLFALESTLLEVLNVFNHFNAIYVPEQQGNENLTTYDYNYENKWQGIPRFRP